MTPTAPKLRTLLTLLVSFSNRLVQTDEIVDELWGEFSPKSALATLHTYVHKLRKALAQDPAGANQVRVLTEPSGYLVEVPPDSIDLQQFTRLAEAGRSALDRGQPERASASCRAALDLWRGHALAGIACGELLSAQAVRLEESRLRTLEIRIEADLRRGGHREVISELKELTSRNGVNEAFLRQLMIALHHSERRGEALEAYRRFRHKMIDELGLEPSRRLRELHHKILTSDTVFEGVPVRASGSALSRDHVPPAQLPADIADFAGRRKALAEGQQWLLASRGGGTAMRVWSVSGMPGVGKTVLALRLAHRVADRFPDGQLFAELGGIRDRPVDPKRVLSRFLQAVGSTEGGAAADLDDLIDQFRTWSAHREVLIVLDDAASAAQVRPLLPGGAGCATIVTSRSRLAVTAGALPHTLRPFEPEESSEMVRAVFANSAPILDLKRFEQLAADCGHLPLMLRAYCTRALTGRGKAVPTYLSSALESLRWGEFDVRASFDASLRSLDQPGRITFLTLGMLGEDAITPRSVSTLLGSDPGRCEVLLDDLVQRNLLGSGSSGRATYYLHPVAATYVRQLLAESGLPQQTALPDQETAAG